MKTPPATGITLFLIAMLLGAPTALSQPTRSPAGHFEFYINPWISLHHFTYHWVRLELPERRLRGRLPIAEADLQAISDDMRAACQSVHPAYQPYIEGNIRSDAKTRGVTESLIDGIDAISDTALRDALTACMPFYETDLWPRHRQAGEKLVSRLMAMLERFEVRMAQRLAETLEGSWPDEPIRVDITPYANWAGAYTAYPPTNITLSSYDEEVSGSYAFEILFHEASHSASFENSIIAAANFALNETGLESNRYWHFILFFATGRLTAEVLDDEDYVPFIEATGLTESESGAPYYSALYDTWDSGKGLRERVLSAARRIQVQ